MATEFAVVRPPKLLGSGRLTCHSYGKKADKVSMLRDNLSIKVAAVFFLLIPFANAQDYKLKETEPLILNAFKVINNDFEARRLSDFEPKPNPPPDCTPQDLREKMPPIRDQDSVGWCYAFTTADLISFKIGDEISPIDIANSTEQNRDNFIQKIAAHFVQPSSVKFRGDTNPEYSGASLQEAIDAAQEKGFCRESDLPIKDKYFSDYYVSTKTYYRVIKDIEASQNNNSGGRECSFGTNLLRNMFPKIPTNEIVEILKHKSAVPLVDRLIDASCNKKRIFPAAKIKVQTAYRKDYLYGRASDSNKTIKKAVNNILDSGRPAGIAYDVSAILKNRCRKENCNHGSSIVGRRWNGEQCEYIIRNSWGTSCFDPRYFDRSKCQDGYFYVPADRIFKEVKEIVYVE